MDNLLKLPKDKHSGKITPEVLDGFKVGYEKLKITPRGKGELDISLTNLYYTNPGHTRRRRGSWRCKKISIINE